MKEPRHKYEYKVSPTSAAAKVARLAGENRRVLELGPGPGAVTRLMKDNGCRVTAIEVDPDAIPLVKPFCEQVLAGDLNTPDWAARLPAETRFDAIVAADVLEHLYQPWDVLQQLHALLEQGGRVVMSLPHIAHSSVLASLLAEDFEYQPWGLLDRTHIRFFGLRNIQRLFNDTGFKIVEVDFVVKTPEQTEFAKHWRRLSPEVREALASNPFGNIYQVIVCAEDYASTAKGLQLTDLSIPAPDSGSYSIAAHGNPVVGFFLSFLSLRNRSRIVRFLDRLGIRL